MLWVRAGARQHAGGVNIETPAAVAQWFGEGVLPDAVMRTKRDALWSMPCCTLMQFPETSFLPCVTPSSPTPGQGGGVASLFAHFNRSFGRSRKTLLATWARKSELVQQIRLVCFHTRLGVLLGPSRRSWSVHVSTVCGGVGLVRTLGTWNGPSATGRCTAISSSIRLARRWRSWFEWGSSRRSSSITLSGQMSTTGYRSS